MLDRDPLWAELARASLARHGELEAATGVQFHHRHPVLFAGSGVSDLTDAVFATGALLQVDADAAPAPPAGLDLPDDTRLACETGDAGWIAPRRLVQAQTLAALAAGAKVVRSPVWALRDAGPDGTRLILDDGSEIVAERVLICAGAFAAPVGLVEGLPLWTEGRTVVLARVDEAHRDAVADLPCLLHHAPGADLEDAYLLPPVRYPDGHDYVKLGSGSLARRFDELDALQDWFRGPAPMEDIERLEAGLKRLVPALADAEMRTDQCALTLTASGRPIIDWTIPGRVAVALGGNGKGAKSSDEIGRLGAALLTESAGAAELAPFAASAR